MSKRLLLILVAIPMFFGCKKDNDSNQNTGYYYTDGFHDVDMGNPANSTMDVNVHYVTGLPHEVVNIEAYNLPDGITADISKPSGTPPFVSTIGFTNNYTADTHGTFPVNINTSSQSGTQQHKINVTVPALQGMVVDGMKYDSLDFQFYPPNSPYPATILMSPRNENSVWLNLTFNNQFALPTTDGTYKVVASPSANDEVSFDATIGSGYYYPMDGSTMQIKFVNGKMKLIGYNLKMIASWGQTVTLAINATQL